MKHRNDNSIRVKLDHDLLVVDQGPFGGVGTIKLNGHMVDVSSRSVEAEERAKRAWDTLVVVLDDPPGGGLDTVAQQVAQQVEQLRAALAEERAEHAGTLEMYSRAVQLSEDQGAELKRRRDSMEASAAMTASLEAELRVMAGRDVPPQAEDWEATRQVAVEARETGQRLERWASRYVEEQVRELQQLRERVDTLEMLERKVASMEAVEDDVLERLGALSAKYRRLDLDTMDHRVLHAEAAEMVQTPQDPPAPGFCSSGDLVRAVVHMSGKVGS